MVTEATIPCPSCRAANAAGSVFCSECGTRFETATPAPKSCPACAQPNRASATFCAHCGAAMTPAAPAPPSGPSPCPACGEVNDEAARFCGGCGKDFGPQPAARAPQSAQALSGPPSPSPAAVAQAKIGAAAAQVQKQLRGLSRGKIIAIVAAVVAVVLIGVGAVYGKRIVAAIRGPSKIAVTHSGVSRGAVNGQQVDVAQFQVAPAQVTLYADYVEARTEEDTLQLTALNEAGQPMVNCPLATAELEAGQLACTVTLAEGRYVSQIMVNGRVVGTTPFRILDSARIRGMITFAAVAARADTGRPAADTRTFYNGSSPVGLYVEYGNGAREILHVTVWRDGVISTSCNDFALNQGSGAYYCQFPSLTTGNYLFQVRIEGIAVGEYRFTVSPNAPPPPPAAPRYCGMTPAWIFEPMCRDESLAQLNDRVLKLQSIFDLAGGTGDMFEKDRWQNDVRTRCFTASSQPECLRASLQTRSEFLQAMIPEALSSNRPAIFKDQARQRWENHDW